VHSESNSQPVPPSAPDANIFTAAPLLSLHQPQFTLATVSYTFAAKTKSSAPNTRSRKLYQKLVKLYKKFISDMLSWLNSGKFFSCTSCLHRIERRFFHACMDLRKIWRKKLVQVSRACVTGVKFSRLIRPPGDVRNKHGCIVCTLPLLYTSLAIVSSGAYSTTVLWPLRIYSYTEARWLSEQCWCTTVNGLESTIFRIFDRSSAVLPRSTVCKVTVGNASGGCGDISK